MIEREQSPFSQSVKARQIRFLIPKPKPGGRKNILNEYATKLINPDPPPLLTKFVIWKAFYLSKTSPITILLVFLGKNERRKPKSNRTEIHTIPPKIMLFQIQKYKNNVFIKHSTATSIFQAEKVVELGLLSLVCTFHTKILPARLTVKDIAGYSLSSYTLKIQCRTYNKIIITFIILDNLIL